MYCCQTRFCTQWYSKEALISNGTHELKSVCSPRFSEIHRKYNLGPKPSFSFIMVSER